MPQVVHITKETLEKLISEGKSERKIADELGFAVMTIRRNLRKYNLKTRFSAENNRTCKVCGKPLSGQQIYFCSAQCKHKHFNKTHSKEASHEQTIRGRKKREELITYKGGKCEICGYSKNTAALTFHHKDINTKSFDLGVRNCCALNIDKLKSEADKCMLLCHNCHMELHHPQCNTEHK